MAMFLRLLLLAALAAPSLCAGIITTFNSSFFGTEGATISSANLGQFTDTASLPASAFTVTINWGDGSPTSAGTVTTLASSFGVSGSHTYAEEGAYTATASILDSQGGTGTITDTAFVSDAVLSATGKTLLFSTSGAFSGVVATFTDANPNGTPSDFSATIHWGDGTTTAGGVAVDPIAGFDVTGSHTYSTLGNFTASVSILDVGGSTAGAEDAVGEVPEPSTFVIAGLGLTILVRKRRASAQTRPTPI